MIKTALLSISVVIFSAASALGAGDAAKGKVLFNDPKFAHATSGRSCNTCHPGGKGLKLAGGKSEFHIAGMTQKTLEDAVNACITFAINGEPIDPASDDMKNIVAYIKSLNVKTGR